MFSRAGILEYPPADMVEMPRTQYSRVGRSSSMMLMLSEFLGVGIPIQFAANPFGLSSLWLGYFAFHLDRMNCF